jgi:hypothetical protein
MELKICRRKAAGTRGQNTPLETSTKTFWPPMATSSTRTTVEDSPLWQSVHIACAAANCGRSTSNGGGEVPMLLMEAEAAAGTGGTAAAVAE